jgi:hypothetical protein
MDEPSEQAYITSPPRIGLRPWAFPAISAPHATALGIGVWACKSGHDGIVPGPGSSRDDAFFFSFPNCPHLAKSGHTRGNVSPLRRIWRPWIPGPSFRHREAPARRKMARSLVRGVRWTDESLDTAAAAAGSRMVFFFSSRRPASIENEWGRRAEG